MVADRRLLAGGLTCGSVTAGALAVVLSTLDDYQVPDHADMDPVVGMAAALGAALAAALLIAALRGSGPRAHVLVPLLLLPVVVTPLVAGLERNRVEAAILFGTAAFAIHLLLGRRGAVTGIVLVVVATGLATWGLQPRWRAQKFEAVGVPLYVPEVPGHRLSTVWAGRWSVSLTLEAPGGTWLGAQIVRGADPLRCGPGRPDRYPAPTNRLGFCLPGGGTMTVIPGPLAPDPTPLLSQITVRKVDGATLAEHPDGLTGFEPD